MSEDKQSPREVSSKMTQWAQGPQPLEDIGTVISINDTPSPMQVNFVVNKNVDIHRGMFVEIPCNEGMLVSLITNLFKTNRYFERAEAVKEFESNGNSLSQHFPVKEWEYLVAITKPLGVFSDSGPKRPTNPPSPGTKVMIAERELLKNFLGLSDEGVDLGRVEHHDLELKLRMNKLVKKHCCFLGISGSGKSHAVNVMLEELLERTVEQGRIGVILFDVHGEYVNLASPNMSKGKDYSNRVKVIKARDIKIGVPSISHGFLSAVLSNASSIQLRDLSRIIEKLRAEMKQGQGPFGLAEIKNELLSDAEVKENTSKALLNWVHELESLNIFSKIDQPSPMDLIKPGELTIVDLSDIISLKKKQIILTFFAQKLFDYRRENIVCPFLLVLEEAHQFVPEGKAREHAISNSIITTIAREGRKFLASLCLISQRPIQLNTTVLSQCNSQIILRITNPYDLDHIGRSSEGINRDALDMITSLRVGEALIVGEAVNYPVFFKVRQRHSTYADNDVPLEDAAIAFENRLKQRNKEAEEFL